MKRVRFSHYIYYDELTNTNRVHDKRDILVCRNFCYDKKNKTKQKSSVSAILRLVPEFTTYIITFKTIYYAYGKKQR